MTRPREWNDPDRKRQPPGTLRGYLDPERPHLAFIRIACRPSLRVRLIGRADKEGTTLSEIVRRACRDYLR